MSKQNAKSLQDPALWENGTISPQLYFEYRLNPLIEWNEMTGNRNKSLYKWLKITQLFLSALVPVLVGFIGDDTVLKFVGSMGRQQVIVAGLGFILTFITSLFSIYQFKDNWINRIKSAQDLRRETMEYLSRTASYYQKSDADAFNQLVQNAESIISGEYAQWVQSMENNDDNQLTTPAVVTTPGGGTSGWAVSGGQAVAAPSSAAAPTTTTGA